MDNSPRQTNQITPFDIFLGAFSAEHDCIDLTILKTELNNLRKAKELLHTIIQATQDAIYIVDETGKVVLVNQAYTKLVGLSEEQLLNQPATVDIAEGFESVALKVLATGKPIKEIHMKVGPTKREVIASAAPIFINNEIKGCVGVFQDVSFIRRLSEELRNANRLLIHNKAKYRFQDIIGNSSKIQDAKNKASLAAETIVSVLLRGESGTGKELFAHAIHNASDRHNKPFVRVNCAAIPENLIESELFGYSEGSFSGAKKGGHKGYFEEASGGTLFLDEIGELPYSLQAKLLRVLQENEIVRIGETQPRPINTRIIAATNAKLEEMIRAKQFREDLYYRLSVLPIYIPALREMEEDIPFIIKFLVAKICKEYGRLAVGLDQSVFDRLRAYVWPGNIRELENVLRRAIINLRFTDETIRLEHIFDFTDPPFVDSNKDLDFSESIVSYEKAKAAWEKALIAKALAAHNGNRTDAANALGISIRNLYKKITKYNLNSIDTI